MTSVAQKALPKVDGDFYHISATMSGEDQALLHRVRTFMETEVAPIINEYWIREEFPHQIVPGLAALGIAGQAYRGYGCPGKSAVLDGLVAVEMARVDSSICTVKMRETVGYARELLAGNGILLDHQVGRFVADAEAIYSYEGTREMNTLIVGRAITGFSAFV